MKHCPNPSCSHARAVGSAAEYVDDRATCGDCGARLEDGPAPERAATATAIPLSLWGRLAITAAVIPALMILQRIPLPGVDSAVIEQATRSTGGAGLANISVVALGIMPLISAAILVQIAALLVPRWRALRWTPAGRARLHKATLITTLALCIFQGYGVTRYLESVPLLGDDIQAMIVWPTLIAGTFLLLGLASLLSKYSLGNGMAALLAAALTPPMLAQLLEQLTAEDGRPPAQRLMVFVLPALFALLTGYALTRHNRARVARPSSTDAEAAHRYREAPESALSPVIRAPASGVVPLGVFSALLSFISILGNLRLPMGDVYALILSGGPVARIVLAAASAALLALVFHPLDQLVDRWSRGLRRRDDRDHVREELRRERRRGALWSVAFVGVLMLIGALGGPRDGFGAYPLAMALLTGIGMDLVAEWRARRDDGELVAIWSEDDVGGADAVMSALAAEAIPVHARGIYLRALLQIMGPYVPIELMVPEARAEDATALLRKRFPEGARERGKPASSSPRAGASSDR